jgi:hypothetical protein
VPGVGDARLAEELEPQISLDRHRRRLLTAGGERRLGLVATQERSDPEQPRDERQDDDECDALGLR